MKVGTPTSLDYYNGQNEVPEGAFRIGASSFSTFVSRPWQWFKEQVLGIGGFEGSTSSILGSVVHYVCEQKAQGKEPDINEIDQYILNNRGNPDVDAYIVEKEWKSMAICVVNEFVLPNIKRYSSVEEFVVHDLGDGIYIGGSIDAVLDEYKTYKVNGAYINGKKEYDKLSLDKQNDCTITSTSGTIVDYKTTSGRVPTNIPANYKQQLLVYAWVLKQLGRTMDRIQLVYITREKDTRAISEKTGKSIGRLQLPETTVLTEQIQESDLQWIEEEIMLCKDKLLLTEQQPDIANLIWHYPESYLTNN